MKLILQESTDSAIVNGVTLTGPLHLDVDSAQIASVDYDRGVVVVSGGSATQVAAMTEAGQWSLLACLIAGLVTGVYLAKQWVGRFGLFLCLLSSGGLAQYTEHVQTRTITNATTDIQKKRISVYAVSTTGGDTYSYVPEIYVDGSTKFASGMGHSGTGTAAIRIRALASNNSLVASIDLGIVSYLNTGNPNNYGYGWTYPETALPAGATKFSLQWKRESPYFQSSYNNLSGSGTVEQTAPTTTTDVVNSRGTLVQQWEIEIAPHGAATVHVVRDFAFYLVIENATAYLDGEGVYHEEWAEEDEFTSTSSTVDDPVDPNTRSEPQAPVYSSGPDPTPVDRPEDVSTNLGMNQAAEARHTESQGFLKDIKTGTDAGVSQAAAAAGQAHSDANALKAGIAAVGNQVADALDGIAGEAGGDPGMGDDEEGGFNDANASAAAMVNDLESALLGLSDEVGAMVSVFTFSVTGAAFPVASLPVPSMLGGGTLTLDFGDYSQGFTLLRTILLIIAGWGFASAILENVRQAVS